MSPRNNGKEQGKRSATRMKDVAEVAGVHVATVSLALKNSPQLPVTTRERIQKIAREMGYQANPLVTALMEQRRRGHASVFQGTLGFITRSPGKHALKENHHTALIYKTAEEKARDYGYRLDHIEIADYNYDPQRLEKVLFARNIQGLLFPAPLYPDGKIIDLNWDHFAFITHSTSIQTPPMDRVDTDHYAASRMAIRTCLERGYKRPGFVSMASSDYRTQARWRAGFTTFLQDYPEIKTIPPLIVEDSKLGSAFYHWWKEWKPDVIICCQLCFEACLPSLKEHGISVPDDLAFAALNVHQEESDYCGIYTGIEISASIAVERLVSKLYHNTLGIPKIPQVILTPPFWHEGKTLPERNTPLQKKNAKTPLPSL